jgi:uncharacterized protein YndB with AHSA1/START domain
MIDDMAESEEVAELRLNLEKRMGAAPKRVFEAFVDAEQLRHWWGPAGFTVSHLVFDAVEGAHYRITMQPPDGDVFHVRGTFRAVDAPSCLSFTFVYEEPDPDDQETQVTLTFEPLDPGTRITLDQGPFKTRARLELHREGWTDTLERLGHWLA